MARRIKALIAAYTARLGDVAADPTVRSDVQHLAELEALAESHRRAALCHTPIADLAHTIRLEGLARRLKRELTLNGKPPPPPPMSIYEYAKLMDARDAAAKAEKAAAKKAAQATKKAAT
jgi:hypothetical protein